MSASTIRRTRKPRRLNSDRHPAATPPFAARNGRSSTTIAYVDHPWFHEPDAGERIEALRPHSEWPLDPEARPRTAGESAGGLARLSGLDSPLLSKPMEKYLFLRMNYWKFRAAHLQSLMDSGKANPANRERIEAWLAEANECRNRIVESNLRLIVANVRTTADIRRPIDECVSDCIAPLIRGVELFDVSKGHCFSTYATHVIRNALRRTLRAPQRMPVPVVAADPIDPVDSRSDESSRRADAARVVAARLLETLSERERLILAARFGMNESGQERTFQEIGRMTGLSKERVRVITRELLERLAERLPAQSDAWGVDL